MATNTQADMTIYNEQYRSGQIEVLAQNVNAFNQASNGALRYRSEAIKGEFVQKTFIQSTANLIRRRDPESTSTVSDLHLTDGEIKTVKCMRGIGPIKETLSMWKMLGSSWQEVSMILGRQVAKAKMQNNVTSILASLVAVLEKATTTRTGTGAASLSHTLLVNGQQLMGDRGTDIVAWVMHSKPFYDLIKLDISDKIFGVANLTIYGGGPASLGKPILVTDSTALIETSSGANVYRTLGLVPNAAEVVESEIETVVTDLVSGQDNISYRVQGEYAVNVGLQGWSFTGSANPLDAALATGSNWTQKAASIKDGPGVCIRTA